MIKIKEWDIMLITFVCLMTILMCLYVFFCAVTSTSPSFTLFKIYCILSFSIAVILVSLSIIEDLKVYKKGGKQ